MKRINNTHSTGNSGEVHRVSERARHGYYPWSKKQNDKESKKALLGWGHVKWLWSAAVSKGKEDEGGRVVTKE